MRVIYSKLALYDLKNIYDFIRKDSLHYAVKEVRFIRHVIKSLQSQPQMGKLFEIQSEVGTRELVYKHYRIIYEIGIDEIQILSIHHSSRSLKNNPLTDK